MVIQAMIDQIPRNQRRNDNRRYPWPILFKREMVLVVRAIRGCVTRRSRRWRNGMVVKSAVLIPCDHQKAAVPVSRISDRFVGSLDETFPKRDIGKWMLGGAVAVVVQNVVTRLDENVTEIIAGVLQITGKVAVMANIAEPNSFQRSNHRKIVASVQPASDVLRVQRVEDGAILKLKTVDGFPIGDFGSTRTVVQAARRGGMDKHPVGPGRTRYRGMPVIANDKFPGERIQHRKLLGGETFHDFPRVGSHAACDIRSNKSASGNWRIRTSGRICCPSTAELLKNVREFMVRINRHHVICAWRYGVGHSVVLVRLASG